MGQGDTVPAPACTCSSDSGCRCRSTQRQIACIDAQQLLCRSIPSPGYFRLGTERRRHFEPSKSTPIKPAVPVHRHFQSAVSVSAPRERSFADRQSQLRICGAQVQGVSKVRSGPKRRVRKLVRPSGWSSCTDREDSPTRALTSADLP